MSKKTVISDFGDLKGKMSFSDAGLLHDDTLNVKKTGNTANRSKDRSDRQAPRTDNDMENGQSEGLKVGQSVVLIDHDLRGRIISLGKTVSIELEDGLIIEAIYGEFAVTDQTELSSMKQAKVKQDRGSARQRNRTSRSSGSGSMTIDLHIEAIPGGRNIPKGQQLQFQLDIFRRTIRENLSHRGMKLIFIHGIGDGILKAAIRKELDEVLTLRCSYTVGDPAVTTVYIK